jgi:hypothetical protein
MKSAIPIAKGTEMIRARAAAQTVPKTRGRTYAQKPCPSSTLEGSATNAGILCAIRKTATAARTRRINDPATRLEVEKTLSPRRLGALTCVGS